MQGLIFQEGDSGDDSSVDVSEVVTGLDGCESDDTVCNWVESVTGSETAGDVSAFFMTNVASIVLIVVIALVGISLIKRLVRHGMTRIAKGTHSIRSDPRAGELTAREQLQVRQRELRVEKRTDTLGGVLVALARVFVWGVAFILILGELGINLAPLVAGAGIAGVALGFGAQKVVGDFLSGMFMIAEDQFGVGDIIDLGEATGTVERITLRTTVLRDIYGTVWHVPNGEVQRVGNLSQEWSKALLDVGVAYGTDSDLASEVLLSCAQELAHDPEWEDAFLDDPELLGIETLAADAVTIRISVRTRPAEQFRVQRELNRRFKRALDEAGIEIPFPQRTVWVREDNGDTDNGDTDNGDAAGPVTPAS